MYKQKNKSGGITLSGKTLVVKHSHRVVDVIEYPTEIEALEAFDDEFSQEELEWYNSMPSRNNH